jgi:hypothetical protein
VRVLQCHPKEARHRSTTARGEGLFQPSILKDRPERSPSAVRDRVHPTLAIMLDESPEGHGPHRMGEDADRCVIDAGRDTKSDDPLL